MIPSLVWGHANKTDNHLVHLDRIFFIRKNVGYSLVDNIVLPHWTLEFYGVLAELELSISFHILKSCSHLANLIAFLETV